MYSKAGLMYGSSSSNNDLQQLWVNHIIDYKVNKEHMTYGLLYSFTYYFLFPGAKP
jgi:hypothetical protein